MPPWTEEAKNIYIGSKEMKWQDRRPTAYWKGNPDVGSDVRVELLKCNVFDQHNWGAEIFRQVSVMSKGHAFVLLTLTELIISTELVG